LTEPYRPGIENCCEFGDIGHMERSLEQMARSLVESGHYRVTGRLESQAEYHPANDFPKLIAAVVDVETTGTDPDRDKIIEFGVGLFEYDRQTGQIYKDLGSWEWFEDPGAPIPPEITTITGIADAMVAGHRIDDFANDLLSPVALVIAHNADFDRRSWRNGFPGSPLNIGCAAALISRPADKPKYRWRRIRAPMTGYPRPSNLYPHAPHLQPDHGPLQRTSHCHSPPTCRIKRDRRSEAPLSRLKSRRFVVRVNHCASVIAICGAFWPSPPPNPTRYQKRRGYFVQTNIVSFQSRITNDLIKPSRINGSCLANSSAASRVLKIPMLPRSANGPMPITSPLALNASTTAL
jgi:Exonuclease